MNSGMFVDESIKLGNAHAEDPLVQVFIMVHGVLPIAMPPEEIILRTIEVVGDPMWVDKNLAKMYLAAAIQWKNITVLFVNEFDDMIIQAASGVFGIHFSSIEEVDIALRYNE